MLISLYRQKTAIENPLWPRGNFLNRFGGEGFAGIPARQSVAGPKLALKFALATGLGAL